VRTALLYTNADDAEPRGLFFSFWEVALPVMAVVIPLFMWSDIVRLKHFFEKKMDIKRIRKEVCLDLRLAAALLY
jgi:hypothetical protein